ncbi:ABC transporter permease [Marinoscillum pacificum]|uniref:ABC transporter permease n=1 Tax=Marinoscillum pacificum TaxID=392723 RepID=UPI002157FC4D|nr:ABC transporter permease [Marinoscillum pacificum]
MNIIYLSYRSILAKPLSSLLSWLLLTFGVTIVVLILLISNQLKNEISKNSQGIDLVIGAKGSPLQLILANVFHVDFPTGNIGLKEAAKVTRSRYIESAIPLSLGDSYQNARIVGTTKAYADLYGGEISDGVWFEGPMQVVLGAEAARKLQLKIGDEFQSQHGLSDDGDSHDAHPFKVVGVLTTTNTVLDKLILTSIQSIWEVHGHEEEEEHHHEEADSLVEISHLEIAVTQEQFDEEEITAMLVKYRSPMGAVMLPRAINSESSFQAASPAFETARLFNIIGVGVQILNLLGILIISISAISVFIALLNSLKDRKYDIAIMRSMGATRSQIFNHILIEGLLITFVGGISGLIISHGLVYVLASSLEGVNPQAFNFLNEEWFVILGCFVIGALASVVPAIMAFKTDISKTLSKG